MKNPPAFPSVITEDHVEHNEGMTLRDYFAAAALIGICSNDPVGTERGCAEWAYDIANQMLEVRNEKL